MELSRDEAFQYVVIDYLSSHKDATLAPTVALGRRPPDLAARLTQGALEETYYVKVDKDGLPHDAFTDASCSREVNDGYLLGVIRDLRFRPALQNGKPVEGVASLNLADLPL